jgi:cyclopropane-fatty-acyl-phospholipid synthase
MVLSHDNTVASLLAGVQERYGKDAKKWFVYWRLFYLACSELFGYNRGEEWGLAHYTFVKQ